MDLPEVSFPTGHDQSANDGIRISSTNNQMQIGVPESAPIMDIGLYLPVPSPNAVETPNQGEDDANFECALYSSSV